MNDTENARDHCVREIDILAREGGSTRQQKRYKGPRRSEQGARQAAWWWSPERAERIRRGSRCFEPGFGVGGRRERAAVAYYPFGPLGRFCRLDGLARLAPVSRAVGPSGRVRCLALGEGAFSCCQAEGFVRSALRCGVDTPRLSASAGNPSPRGKTGSSGQMAPRVASR